MSRSSVLVACIVCLCLAGAVGAGGAVSPAPAMGDDESVTEHSPAIAVNETEATETPTPIGVSLGPIRVTDVSLTRREITIGEQTVIVATIGNRGDETGTLTVTATAGYIEVGEQTVRVEPGETRTVRFTYRPEKPGEYLILVNGRSPGVLTVHRIDRVTTLDLAARYVAWGGFLLGGVSLLAAVLVSMLLAIGHDPHVGNVRFSVQSAERLWLLGSLLLLLGIVAGSGLPARGAEIGVITLVGYAIYAVAAVLYRSGT